MKCKSDSDNMRVYISTICAQQTLSPWLSLRISSQMSLHNARTIDISAGVLIHQLLDPNSVIS